MERIKEVVIKALRQTGALDREIEQGIEQYVIRHREAAARREEDSVNAAVAKVRPVSATRDHLRGDPVAPVSLIEYSDFECPFCKRFRPIAKEIVEAYSGKVNWVYRHFPLDSHNPAAQREAEAAECVAEPQGNEAFWRYTDSIYARTRSNGWGVADAELPALTASIGADKAKLSECLRSDHKAARVKEGLAEGSAIGIAETPGNILRNNRTGAVVLRAGALPVEQIKPAIDDLLK